MNTDRIFREEDAIWWDANVRGPRRYSLREMDQEYDGLSPEYGSHRAGAEPQRIVIVDPNHVRVDISWMNIVALSILMLGALAAFAFAAALAAGIAVFAVIVFGIIVLVGK